MIVCSILSWYVLKLQSTTEHVYLDKNAFNDPTAATVTLPVVSCLTCSETTIKGLVPNGMSLIFKGFNLNLH
jgi:hypothetical protein